MFLKDKKDLHIKVSAHYTISYLPEHMWHDYANYRGWRNGLVGIVWLFYMARKLVCMCPQGYGPSTVRCSGQTPLIMTIQNLLYNYLLLKILTSFPQLILLQLLSIFHNSTDSIYQSWCHTLNLAFFLFWYFIFILKSWLPEPGKLTENRTRFIFVNNYINWK